MSYAISTRPGTARCRLAITVALALCASLPMPIPLSAQAGAQASEAEAVLARAVEAHRTGTYDDALGLYGDATGNPATAERAWRGMVETLTLTGDYEEAEERAREGLREVGGVEILNALGEALLHVGRLDEAAAAFERAMDSGAEDALQARLNFAVLLFQRGQRQEALEIFDSFIDVYNRNRGLAARDLTAVGTAVRHLGRTDPALFQDALRAYDEAVDADPSLMRPRILTGELFLEKYNSQEARATLQEALSRNPNHPDALLAMARAMDFDNEQGAVETARRVLEINPRHVPTRVFLAQVYLQLERYDEALTEAQAALETNPHSLDGLSILAATHHLLDETEAFREVEARADSLYPGNATLALTVAEVSATHRRYEEAVVFASDATRRDPRNWRAIGTLGINQLRVRDVEVGRRNLERAFEGDPYNVWFKNTLDLLDTWEEYETIETEHFDIVVHRDEVGVLAPYIAEFAEDAFDELAAIYQHEPPYPIRLEVYPSHADFSVRTVGLTGLGALGINFGKVVVLDSPTARDPASFNWASVLWHEIAHSVHMSLSNQRVPRWFSEGLAVHDQRRAEDGWGHGASPAFIQAYVDERMPSASRLNDGFMRPEFPGQVVLSYYQASLLFQYLEREWGFDSIRRLLRGYADGSTTAELLPRILGVETDELDQGFDAYIRERFRSPIEALASQGESAGPMAAMNRSALEARIADDPDDFGALLALGSILAAEGELEEAVVHLEAAQEIFPEYAGNDSPHWTLAQIRQQQERPADAVVHLERLRRLNESHLPGALMEAEIRREMGDREGAVVALERALEIAPFEAEIHQRLADTYADLDDWERAVREREAIVALAPVDITSAWYELARAQFNAGDSEAARSTVLRALERAPRFQAALDLLLEIRTASPAAPAAAPGGNGDTGGTN